MAIAGAISRTARIKRTVGGLLHKGRTKVSGAYNRFKNTGGRKRLVGGIKSRAAGAYGRVKGLAGRGRGAAGRAGLRVKGAAGAARAGVGRGYGKLTDKQRKFLFAAGILGAGGAGGAAIAGRRRKGRR